MDEATGDIYVYDAAAGTVYKFDAAGEPQEFSALKTNAMEGVGVAELGEREAVKAEIAVDNSAGPAKGNIYVENRSHVGIYSSSGTALGELNGEAAGPWGTAPCGVAVQPSWSCLCSPRGSRTL